MSNEILENTLSNVMVPLLKDIADNMKYANEIRKQEQTELWKEMKELKTTSDRMYNEIYRESEVRPGILQTQKNLHEAVFKMQNIVYSGVGIIAFINMLPMIKDFIILLTK